MSAKWTARDWRQGFALLFLSLAPIPLSGVMFYALRILQLDPGNTYVHWLGQSAAGLILTVVVGVSAILGRRTFKFKVGDAEVHAEGEEGDKVLEGAT